MLRRIAVGVLTAGVLASCAAAAPPPPADPPAPAPSGGPSADVEPLTVQGRHLATASGEPWFWLGDTAWALPARLDRAETARYLDVRAAQG